MPHAAKASPDPRPAGRRALTLVELLTVIAIIAILAAIAVPNFLEAQIRSKNARTHNDMASVAIAINAYRADHSAFPPNRAAVEDALATLAALPPGSTTNTVITHTTPQQPEFPLFDSHNALFQQRLTTPIAYLTSHQLDTYSIVPEDMRENGDWPPRHLPLGVLSLSSLSETQRTEGYGFSAAFLVYSSGPALVPPVWNPATGSLTLYDPTNGTVSGGMILQVNGRPAMARDLPPVVLPPRGGD